MKKVLILVVSSNQPPYEKMIHTSLRTWESIHVDNVETVFYCGETTGTKYNSKVINFPFKESYATMGHKMLAAFEWALANKEFDFIARVNSSCYVDKRQLIEYCNELPNENLFSCIEVAASAEQYKWAWGGGQFILSKDVVQKVLVNKGKWDHSKMEDVSLSRLIDGIGIPYAKGKVCSLNEKGGCVWSLMGYNGGSIEFSDFNDVKPLKHHFYRVKIDRDRSIDEFLMDNLYSVLK